jgi:hypothetical protein
MLKIQHENKDFTIGCPKSVIFVINSKKILKMKKFILLALTVMLSAGVVMADKKCCKNKSKCTKTACAKKSCSKTASKKACCAKKSSCAKATAKTSCSKTAGKKACCKKKVAASSVEKSNDETMKIAEDGTVLE